MVQTLGERYVIGDEIGRGGMAVVCRAHDERLDRDVAVKLLRTDPPPSPEVLDLFRQEALATSRLTHPHIVNLHDFGELPDGQLFLVMELLQGCTLAQVLEECRTSGMSMSWARAAGIALQICAGLTVAHAHKILHRDMTPANCFLVGGMRRDHVKILDFGISRVRASTQSVTITRGTKGEPLMGTPYYMAPEVLRGKRGDHRVDVYAVGVLLYEMTTGARPFAATNLYVLLRAVAEGSFVPPRVRNPRADLDEAQEAVILRAMASDPAERYQSAAELADALEALLHQPASSPPPLLRPSQRPANPWEQTLPAALRRPRGSSRVATFVTTGLLGVGALTVWLLVCDREREGERAAAPVPSPPPPLALVQAEPAPPPLDRTSEVAALQKQRWHELDDGVKKAKTRRDECLIATRTYMAAYYLPVEFTVAANGTPQVQSLPSAEQPKRPRLPAKAETCMLQVLESIPFAPANLAVTLREMLLLE